MGGIFKTLIYVQIGDVLTIVQMFTKLLKNLYALLLILVFVT
ncbi:45402_t:CDS:2 [Gigaspora margarita]|uniref:45402_t:CDS:1 n=1 Tax=Gigaspora margarita TaxID=4874 RepID=A0ABN7UD01_GIGMA|nr:45402_t:CDS:2 [Gigaspora margarita]